MQAPSGFPDLSPKVAIAQTHMLDVIRGEFERAGYSPLETSLVERPEVLLAKGGGEISTQVYALRRLNVAPGEDTDAKDLALRFDHTVPLARFVATNRHDLSFPFRRYSIGPVFRGERAKNGRYRQFTQADIDVIGEESLSLMHDAEMVSVIDAIFTKLAIGPFTIRIGNRKVLGGILEATGLDQKDLKAALATIDRLEKDGVKETVTALAAYGIERSKAEDLIELLTSTENTDAVLASLKEKAYGPLFSEGLDELTRVVAAIRTAGVPENHFRIDISIARGLDYYTGTVFETRFDAHQELGSIASGGRYEDLASTFTKRRLPGVGISIGVTRLLLRLIEAKLVPADTSAVAKVLVTTALGAESHASVYLDQARRLREAGVPTEVYLEEKPLEKQLKFADQKGFTLALITEKEDVAKHVVVVKEFKTGTKHEVPVKDLVTTVQKLLLA